MANTSPITTSTGPAAHDNSHGFGEAHQDALSFIWLTSGLMILKNFVGPNIGDVWEMVGRFAF